MKWTEDDINKLLQMAKTHKKDEIARELNRTENAIELKAAKLGIKVYSSVRRWEDWENEYLMEKWGNVSLKAISKRLNRTPSAVIQEAKKLGLGSPIENTHLILMADFSRLSGIYRTRITRTLAPQFSFPLEQKTLTEKRKLYYVDIEKALKWMEQNQSLFDASKISEYLFCEEPQWLIEKRRVDYKSKHNIDYQLAKRKWEDWEVEIAKSLLYLGKGYKEIGERLGRSTKAVSLKLRELGYSYKLKQYWKGEEFRYIEENWEKKTDKEIAEHLGRPVSSVTYQRKQLGHWKGGRA